MTLSKEKSEALQQRMDRLEIRDSDLVEKFILGTGPGGQKVNKTASCVYLKHLPTGLEVKCSQNRSRELNRYLARRLLCERLEKKLFDEKTAHEKELDKLRKQKKRRSRRQKQKMVEGKREHSEKKELRKAPSEI